MLPVALRLRHSGDIRATIRRGVSAGRGGVVVHGMVRDDDGGARVAFAISRTVGSAVVRNKVRRRMRGVVIEQREMLPTATDLVLRARPSAPTRSYSELRRDVVGALAQVTDRLSASRADR